MAKRKNIKHTLRSILRPPYYFMKDCSVHSKKAMAKNATLKNKYEGQRIFLLLSGESLSCIDIPSLKGEYTAGCGFMFLNKGIRDLPLSFMLATEPGPSMDKLNAPGSCNWPEELISSNGLNQGHIFLENVKTHLVDKGTVTFLDANKLAYYKKVGLFKLNDPNVFYVKSKPYFLSKKKPKLNLTKRFDGGEGGLLNLLLIIMYMGFKEIYLCGAGYTYEPVYMYHFYDNVVYPKAMGQQKAEIEARKTIDARNKKTNSDLQYYGLFEKDDSYRAVYIRKIDRNPKINEHHIIDNYAKSLGVKIYNILPDGFESPVYEKVSWQEAKNKVLPDKGSDVDTKKDYLHPKVPSQRIELKDDFELLGLMLKDSKNQPDIYCPGPYWTTKAKNAANEIKRCGIADFRGSKNAIGLSYADNLLLDIRNSYNHSFRGRFMRRLANTYPLSNLFEAQIRWTKLYANKSIIYAQEILNLKEKTKELLGKYHIPYSLLGKCSAKAKVNGRDLSIHYLDILEQHNNIAQHINFNEAKSIFEIGGGFGANIHLLIENYKNIRKILYLDIPPNLYVGTQYLKAFYGNAIVDFRSLRNRDSIKFSENDDLEIFCIAPWQIETFESPVDIFMNSRSFVEMPKTIVGNYVDKFEGLPGSTNSAIALTTYKDSDSDRILHSEELLEFFKDRKFDCFETDTLLDTSSKNLFFLSPGKLSL